MRKQREIEERVKLLENNVSRANLEKMKEAEIITRAKLKELLWCLGKR